MPVQTAVLQDALMWSESLAAQAMGTLDTVSDRLSDMETLLAPITQRTGVRQLSPTSPHRMQLF